MKIALVHDYLNEYGGAEEVLRVLSEMYPEAPIYTAFKVPGSTGAKAFEGKRVVSSWFERVPYYEKLYSPLRFLIPKIWGSFDLREYDVIISSASWYITKGFEKKPGGVEICYCHTPPRWLYGYSTSVDLQKYWPVRAYSLAVGHFLRMYDFRQAQRVDMFVANSRNVAARIRKFYRREAKVIYPPVGLVKRVKERLLKREDYYLMVTRLVGGKGVELAIEGARRGGFRLKVAGEAAGWANLDMQGVEYLGRVSDEEKWELMRKARGFLALSKDEDFGIAPVEAQMVGTPVVAYNGGGYKESVISGKTGVLFSDYSVEGLIGAVRRFERLDFDRKLIIKTAEKFSKERFVREMGELVEEAGRAR